MKPYRILIAWNGEKFQGASMQEREGEEFRFIPETVWPDLCETINADALATVDALRAERDASKGSADALANAILAAETKKDCMQLARNQLRPERDAKIAAKQAEIAAKQAELAALQSN